MVTVAFDATPLLGVRTGIGNAVAGWLQGLAVHSDLVLTGYGLTLSGWRALPSQLPSGVRWAKVPLPAAALLPAWARSDVAPVEWWSGGPVDVVHGTNFVVPPARRAARIVTVWDLTCVRFPEMCAPAALRYPALVARAVATGATVHVTSRAVADEVVACFHVPDERVVVAYPGVGQAVPGAGGGSSEGRGATSVRARREAGSGSVVVGAAARAEPAGGGAPTAGGGAPYVLALGTVEPRKDLPTLVRAFDQLASRQPGLELRIAGPVGWGEDALRSAIGSAAHRARIHRLGWVADPRALLAGAAVFAYPSRYEGFGFPPLEAMAAGVPVVATAVGSLPEVLGDAATLVPAGDAEALADGLGRALDDAAERRRLVAAGLARVADYGWDRATSALAELYRRAAEA